MEALPACVLEQVLFLLPARDVVHVAMTSSSMREVALSETFWAAYVRNRWGTQTEVENWISEHPQGIFQHQKSQLKHPGTYSLYERMIGVWKDLGDDHLWQFQWRSDCIEGVKLDLVTPKWLAQTWRSHSLSSKGLVTVDLIDHHLCWLKTYAVEENLLVMSPNKHAEDACVVALGGHASNVELGLSPPGSFNHEMLQFMSMNVSGRRRSNGKRRRHGQGPGPLMTSQYWLKRIPGVVPSKAHSLSGLWWGDPRPDDPLDREIVYLEYDFSRRHAVVKAFEVRKWGREGAVPLWMANSQPLSSPLPIEELQLIQLRPSFLRAVHNTAGVGIALMTDFDLAGETAKKVVAVHKGQFTEHPSLLGQNSKPFRLWQYDDGSLAAVYAAKPSETERNGITGRLVEYERVKLESLATGSAAGQTSS